MSKVALDVPPKNTPQPLMSAELKPLHQLQQIITFPPPPAHIAPVAVDSQRMVIDGEAAIGSRRERTFILFSELRRIQPCVAAMEMSASPPKGSQASQQLEREKDPLEWVVSVGRTSAQFDGIAPLHKDTTTILEQEMWWERSFSLVEIGSIIAEGVGTIKEKLARLADSIKMGKMTIRNYVEGRHAKDIIVRIDITETWKMLLPLSATTNTSFSLMEMLAVVVPNQHQRTAISKSLIASQQEITALRKELDKVRRENDNLVDKNKELLARKGGAVKKAKPTLGDVGFIPGVTHKPLQTFGTSALSLAKSIPGISPPPLRGSQSGSQRASADPPSPTKAAKGKGGDVVDESGFLMLSDDD